MYVTNIKETESEIRREKRKNVKSYTTPVAAILDEVPRGELVTILQIPECSGITRR